MPDFSAACDPAAIERLARHLWGEPTHKTRDELRFGAHSSKSVKPKLGIWFDFETNEGGHYRDLYKLAHGSYPENGSDHGFHVPSGMLRDLGNPVGWWDYHDEHGATVARVVRFEPPGQPRDEAGKPAKTFRQCRPNGAGWVWKMDGIWIPLYRLPALQHAPAGSVVI